MFESPLPLSASEEERRTHYRATAAAIDALLEGEDDWTSAMATVACELHHAFAYYNWTGFYRAVSGELRVGPYQGSHGCLRIGWGRGVCGAAAASKRAQRVADVDSFDGHIACSSTTKSEIVVPVLTPKGEVLAVLDVDSDAPAAFTEVDQEALEALAGKLGHRFGA